MDVEFVLENKSLQRADKKPLSIRLFYQASRWQGKVTIFEKGSDGALTIAHHRSDTQARIYLQPKSGHEYLIDHVTIRPPLKVKMQARHEIFMGFSDLLLFPINLPA